MNTASSIVLAVTVLILLVLFFPLFIPVELAWRKDQNYSHGYLIPIICIWLFARSWTRAGDPESGDTRMALLTLIPGSERG
ncbi:MAG: exosortase/archaeosortase family protein [Planctomycetes bacterium]|nr:exosortase/archaeosortase family protein [Planctomycetota bacterium]